MQIILSFDCLGFQHNLNLFTVKKLPGAEVPGTLPRHHCGFKEPCPVISFSLHKQSSQNGNIDSEDALNGDDNYFAHEEASFTDQPIFFRYLGTS